MYRRRTTTCKYKIELASACLRVTLETYFFMSNIRTPNISTNQKMLLYCTITNINDISHCVYILMDKIPQ